MSSFVDQIEALLRDPTSEDAAAAVRSSGREGADGALLAYARAFDERGKALRERGLTDEAVDSFLEAALVYEEDLDDLAAAAAAYSAVLEIDPGHRRAIFTLGLLLYDLRRFDDLIALYRSRLDASLDDGERTTLHLYVAEILDEKMHDEDGAFDEITKAARLTPRNLRIISRLERLGERTGRLDEVAVVLGDLLMNQDEPRVRAGLALRLAELYLGPLDDHQRALAHFRSALADDGGNPQLLKEVQDVFREQQRFDDLASLLEDLTRDRRTGPHRVRIERELARIHETELGDLPRALQILSNLAKEYPEERDLIDEVMRLGLLAQDMASVARTFEEVCQSTNNALLGTYLRLKLGHIYGQVLDQPTKAIEVYEAIIAEEPDHREAQRRLAQTRERLSAPAPASSAAPAAIEGVGESAVSTDVSEEPTEFDGEEYGPESETAFSATNDAARAVVHLATPDDRPALEGGAFSEAGESGEWTELFEDSDAKPARSKRGKGKKKIGARSRTQDAIKALKSRDWSQSLGTLGGAEDEAADGPTYFGQDPAPGAEDDRAELEDTVAQVEISQEETVAEVEPAQELAAYVSDELLDEEDSEVEVDDADVLAEERSTSAIGMPLAAMEAELEAPTPSSEIPPPVGSLSALIDVPPPTMSSSGDKTAIEIRNEAEERLVELQQTLQDATRQDDRAKQVEILTELVREHLALGAVERAYAAQTKLVRLETSPARFEELIELAGRSEASREVPQLFTELGSRLDVDAQARLGILVANLEAEDLGSTPAAIKRLALLHAEAPDDIEVFDRWVELLEFEERHMDLFEALSEEGRRVLDVQRARALYHRAAEVAEQSLKDPARAADALLAFLARDPEDELLALEAVRLLEAAGRHEELAQTLENRVYRLQGSERAMLRRRIATLYEEKLSDFESAERMLRLALSEDERDAESLELLVRIYERGSRWPELVSALAEQIPLAKGNRARSAIRRRIATVAEQRLRNFDLALQHLDEAVRDDPSDLDTMADIERMRRVQQDWAGVTEVLMLRSHALSNPTERADTLVEIARLRQSALGDMTAAAQAYRDALALDPNHSDALDELAALAERTGELATATEMLGQLASRKKGPERAQVLARLGAALEMHHGRGDEAALEYERALEADPACIDALSPLRRYREEHHEYAAAFELCTREAALARDSRQKCLLWSKAGDLARNQLEDPKAAIDCYEHALASEESDINTAASLGELYLVQQKPEQAHRLLVKSAGGLERADTTRALELWSLAGDAAEILTRIDDAISAFEAARALLPTARKPLLRLGELYEQTGAWEKVFEVCTDLILHYEAALGSRERAQVYARMARAKQGLLDLDVATRLARKSLDLAPNDPQTLALLADLLEAQEQAKDAAETLTRLAKIIKEPAERRSHLVHAARLYGEQAEEPGEAVLLLADLHSRDPADVEVTGLLARYREDVGEYRSAATALIETGALLEGRPAADLYVEAARIVAAGSGPRQSVLGHLLDATHAWPTHPIGLRQLSIFLERDGEYRALAELQEEAARTFLAREETAADTALPREEAALQLLVTTRDIYRYRLEQPLDALRVARKQRELRTASDEERLAFVRLLDEAAVQTRQLELKHEAVESWSKLVEEEPGLLHGQRRLFEIRSELGQQRLARVNAEILVALGEVSESERRRFEADFGDGRSPPPPVSKLGEPVEIPEHPSERSPLAHLFGLLGHHLINALSDALPEPRPKRKERAKIGDLGPNIAGPLFDVIELFGASEPNIYLREDAPRAVQPTFVDGKPGLMMNLSMADQESEALLRFALAWSISFLRPRALALGTLPLEVIREAFEGVVRDRIADELLFSDPKIAKKRGRALEKILPAAHASSIVDEIEKWMRVEDRTSLHEEREAVLRTADRAGLLACGSPLVAIEALKIAGRRERSRLHPLLEFSSSRVFASVLSRSA